jgi:hypothetical protein
MRWFALYLRAATYGATTQSTVTSAYDELAAAIQAADEIAQNWLVVRNLFIKHARSKPNEQPRLAAYCVGRLEQIVDRTEELAQRLEALADFMPDTEGPGGR